MGTESPGGALPEPLIFQHELLEHPIEVLLGPGHAGPTESRGCRDGGDGWVPRSPDGSPRPTCTPRELIPLRSIWLSWDRRSRFSAWSCSISVSRRWGCFAIGDCRERARSCHLQYHKSCKGSGGGE